MWIKPKAGLKVRLPHHRLAGFMPEEGMEVPADDLYWHRLLLWGDVVAAPPEVPPGGSEVQPDAAAEQQS